MKTRNLLNLPASVQAVFTLGNRNVQEVTHDRPLTVATKTDAAIESGRPRVLAQRAARQSRRFAH